MQFLSIILIALFSICTTCPIWAANTIKESDLNVRNINIGTTGNTNSVLEGFMENIREFFFSPGETGGTGIMNAIIQIAFNIKNFFIAVAVIFLIIGIIRLLFSSSDEEHVKKWRSNIIYVSLGIFVMQIAFSVWNVLIIRDTTAGIGSMLGWHMWVNIFSPIVGLMQLLASFGFLGMMIYAFFIIVSGGGDEEKAKKGKNIVIYGLIGFLLIRVPRAFISAIYGSPSCRESEFLWTSSCTIKNQDLAGSIGIIGNIINFLNTFLAIICVILIIYAGWLVLISGGDEEKLKKAKRIILYIIIGLFILVASHAIFRFFVMKN